jgi:hypothetical protein
MKIAGYVKQYAADNRLILFDDFGKRCCVAVSGLVDNRVHRFFIY